LSSDEVKTILATTRNQTEQDVNTVYLNTGCRSDELNRILVKHINLEKNEIFIDGTKTKMSKRTMPIMPLLRPILERLVVGRNNDEKLFPTHSINTIRIFHKLIKNATGINFTLKDYRHTAATNFKDAGIPMNVYARWFGWSDASMAKEVYTHVTDYEKRVSQEWAAKFK